LRTRGLEAVEADDSHPLRVLFDTPNKYLDTWPEFIFKSMVHVVGTGDCYWEMVGGANFAPPSELYLMQPDRVTILPDRKTWIGGYKYKVGHVETRYAPEEVLHYKLPHPMNDLYGLSRADTLDAALKLSNNAYRFNNKFFENGASLSGWLAPEGDVQLDIDAEARMREMFAARHVGIANMGKVGLFNAPMKFIPSNAPPKDLEFRAAIEQAEHEISGVTGVPRALTGRTADVNRSNLDAMKVLFWTQTMQPNFALLCARMNQTLCPRYEEGLFVEPDYSGVEVLQEEQNDRSTRAVNEFNASIITRNEAREAAGGEPLETPDGDVFKVANTEKFIPEGTDPQEALDEEKAAKEQQAKDAADRLKAMQQAPAAGAEQPAGATPAKAEGSNPTAPARSLAEALTMGAVTRALPDGFGDADHLAAIAAFESDARPFRGQAGEAYPAAGQAPGA
jgi:HK97 family phage portal protein